MWNFTLSRFRAMMKFSEEVQMTDGGGRNKRSAKNILLRPDFQLRYSFYFVGSTLVIMGGVFLLFLFSLKDMLKTLAVVYRIEPDVMVAINSSLQTATVTTVAVAIVFGVISFSLGVVLSHRLVGPMVPIRRLINQLADGEYGRSGRLREKDDFQEVMADLNRLSQLLAEKHGAWTPPADQGQKS
ncbi:MAG TPA: hypothetical protein PLZ57_11230 [Pseudobdellovibrionaceae bacterium]|nr:hypothetical protein [Pseudobdellovibrionaceae bacterium]